MHTIKITKKVKVVGVDGSRDFERDETIYEQEVENLDVAAVIAVVNGLEKKQE